MISTPVRGIKAKQTENLSFNLSPIRSGQPTIRFADISLSKSQSIEIPQKKKVPKIDNYAQGFFNPNLIWSPVMGERRVEVNLDHDSMKDLVKSFVQTLNANSEALTGKSIIEISHTDEEVLDEVLKKTNHDTLIRLALLPRNSAIEVLEQSMKSVRNATLSDDINDQSKSSHLEHPSSVTHVTFRNYKKRSLSYQNLYRTSSCKSKSPDAHENNGSCVEIENSMNISSQSYQKSLDKVSEMQYVTHRKTRSNNKSQKSSEGLESPILDRHRISSVSSDFLGFNNTEESLNFEMSPMSGKDSNNMTADPIRESDNRNDITTGSFNLSDSQMQDKISLNYLTKTLEIVEENLDESFSSNCEQKSHTIPITPKPMRNFESIIVEDSPTCSRNDVTQGVVQILDNYPECNQFSKSISSNTLPDNDKVLMETDNPEVSVIPATPIVTRRLHRKTAPKSIQLTSEIITSAPQATAADNVSVIECTFSETANQRRVTRRMTKKNVQFTEKCRSLDNKQPEMSQLERKTVAFQVPTLEMSVEPSVSIHLAPGKWRKSLAAWKRQTLALSINTTTNEIANNQTKLSKAEFSTKKISGIRKSDGRWLSTIGRMTIQEENENDEDQGKFLLLICKGFLTL